MEAGDLRQVADHKRTDVLEQTQIRIIELRSLAVLKTDFEWNKAAIKYLLASAEHQHDHALTVFFLLVKICWV